MLLCVFVCGVGTERNKNENQCYQPHPNIFQGGYISCLENSYHLDHVVFPTVGTLTPPPFWSLSLC